MVNKMSHVFKFLMLTAMCSLLFTGFGSIDTASAAIGSEVQLLHGQYEAGLFKGSIEVDNIAESKQVNVVWRIFGRTDGWKTTQATFAAPTDGNFEAWEFSTDILSHYSPKVATSASVYGLEFYLEYYANNTRYIDDNGGNYYRIGGYDQPEAILKKPVVKLGNVAFGSSNDFKGHIYLKNIATNKEVKIVYSTDNWATVQQAWAYKAYTLDHTNNTMERWEYDVPVAADVNRIEIAVLYVGDGTQYWDTHYNRNYIIQR